MGLLSWLFPSEEDRVAKAAGWMEREDWAEARLALMGIDNDEAKALLATCEQQLCQLNLDAAVSWAEADDEDRIRHHLDVAENFRSPEMAEAFRTCRRTVRTIRETQRDEAKAKAEAQRKSAEPDILPEFLAENPFGDADDEGAARIALIVESYDPALKSTVGELGAGFARALIDLEDGRADLALQGLLALPEDSAVVRYERARVAYAMGDAGATARELRAFLEIHGSHVNMGRHHTATFLATALAEAGDVQGALAILRKERKKDRNLGAGLYASLLEASGELEEAETELVRLVKTYSRDSGLYAMLGRVRAKAGNRAGAMITLEAGLEACACKPGQCGYKPPDVRVIRTLATLYLEDGVETARGLELAGQAMELIQQPAWDDVYLEALAARVSGRPEARQMAASLWEHTPVGDSRQDRLTRFLPAPAES